ncbi:MAG: hypothetical protein O3A46_10585 [Candidatus Poribacteria bacterium]|nr:hypothetical protein [Candidatus Poribacteria bacterium]
MFDGYDGFRLGEDGCVATKPSIHATCHREEAITVAAVPISSDPCINLVARSAIPPRVILRLRAEESRPPHHKRNTYNMLGGLISIFANKLARRA